MRAGVLVQPGVIEVGERPDPSVPDGAVLVRVRAAGICGSDLRTFRHGHARVSPPAILGHEIAGEIVQVGSAVSGVLVGDRVQVTPRIHCGSCTYCRRRRYVHCLRSHSIGYDLPGGFAEYVLVPAEGVAAGVVSALPASVSLEDAVLAESLACCLRSQDEARWGEGDVVVVLGAGPVGLLQAQLALASNVAECIVIEPNPERRRQAHAVPGLMILDPAEDPRTVVMDLTDGRGADVVIAAASAGAAQRQAFELAAKGGRVGLFAGLPQDANPVGLDTNVVHYRELRVFGTHSSTPEDNRRALSLMESRRINVSALVSHRVPLGSLAEAFRLAESGEALKVVVVP